MFLIEWQVKGDGIVLTNLPLSIFTSSLLGKCPTLGLFEGRIFICFEANKNKDEKGRKFSDIVPCP